jgi:4-carboxymuconolactone decarboxylase
MGEKKMARVKRRKVVTRTASTPEAGGPQRNTVPAPATAAIAEGMRVYKAVPQLGRLRDEVLFGDVWKQPELSQRDRSIVTCAILATLGRSDELHAHVRRAVDNGVTKDELRGMAVQLAFYAGWPAGIALGRAALAILEA